jgi:integrase
VTATIKGTKADAKRELRRRLGTTDEGAHVDPSRITVANFIDRWIKDWAATNVSPKTLEHYTSVLRHAVQWRVVQSNVASSTDAPKAETAEIEILEPGQAKDVLGRLRVRNAPGARQLHTIVTTALGTGMRRGELLALRWQDVDLDGAVLKVERSLEQTKAQGLRFKGPKTKHGRRSITLPAFLVATLRAHWKAQQEDRLALGLGKAPDGALVFPGPDFEPRSPNAMTKEWAAAARAIGVKASFHAWRHTHACQLIASGMDVLAISRRLGHSSPTITLQVYGHRFKNSDARAAEVMDAAFSASRTE